MSKLAEVVRAMHEIDQESQVRRRTCQIHPLAILSVTVLFLGVTSSFSKYQLLGVSSMVLFLMAISIWEEISLWRGMKRMKYIFFLLLLLGGVNPFFDRQVLGTIGNLHITGGVLSMLSLWIKGILMVWACYCMMIQIGVEGICLGLQTLRVPADFVTQILLTYRYLIVLLRESDRMWTAYKMRAPGHGGIHWRAWGSFPGLLLIRSVDRAERIQDAMVMQGYQQGQSILVWEQNYSPWKSLLYVVVWSVLFVILRKYEVFAIVGGLF